MTDLLIGTTREAERALDDAAVEAFRGRLRAPVIRPGDDTYDEARKIWNGMIDRRPALIVKCTGVADVIDAVNFARDNQLLIAIRGGSHSAAGHAMCDGGIVLDMSSMKG